MSYSVWTFGGEFGEWLGEAKVSCLLYHNGNQLRLAYSWVSPAILTAGNDRAAML